MSTLGLAMASEDAQTIIFLRASAEKVDRMIYESIHGGWSTNNVEGMRTLASELRSEAIRLEEQ